MTSDGNSALADVEDEPIGFPDKIIRIGPLRCMEPERLSSSISSL